MRSYYPWLDLLRFAAALSVAFFHLMFSSWAGDLRGLDRYLYSGAQFPSAVAFTWFGWVGVEIFFVISGFVIANSASKASPIEFLINRALRLYPAVWVCATAAFVVLLIFARDSFPQLIGPYIRSMLLVPRGPWIDDVYWTLSAEISFYALVFVLLALKRVTLLHAAWALTIYSGIFNAFFLLAMLKFPLSHLYWFFVIHRVTAAPLLMYHGCLFALGIWFWAAANRKLRPLERFGLVLAFISGAAEIYSTSLFHVTDLPAVSGQWPLVPVAVYVAAMCVVGFTAMESRRSINRSVPGAGYFRTVGLITYPLYLTHKTVGGTIARVLIEAGLDATLSVLVALSSVIALCWVVCLNIEPPLRALMKQFLSCLGLLPTRATSLSPISRQT
ncbi:MAG: acyltransferase [Bradyrhizobium sp.]